MLYQIYFWRRCVIIISMCFRFFETGDTMPITAVIMLFFGGVVLYDTYKHKKDRKPIAKLLITLIGIFSIAYGLINCMQVFGLL